MEWYDTVPYPILPRVSSPKAGGGRGAYATEGYPGDACPTVLGHAMAPQTALQVLVVDDEPGILSGLTRFLQRDGHTVQTATDGHAAKGPL
jgi:hypothetical protein